MEVIIDAQSGKVRALVDHIFESNNEAQFLCEEISEEIEDEGLIPEDQSLRSPRDWIIEASGRTEFPYYFYTN